MVWLVGTASWTDKTPLDSGRFYPESVKTPEARLRFYASQFNLVEVDTSYYAVPVPTTTQRWMERTMQCSTTAWKTRHRSMLWSSDKRCVSCCRTATNPEPPTSG